jgi:hypothetical protein
MLMPLFLVIGLQLPSSDLGLANTTTFCHVYD